MAENYVASYTISANTTSELKTHLKREMSAWRQGGKKVDGGEEGGEEGWVGCGWSGGGWES